MNILNSLRRWLLSPHQALWVSAALCWTTSLTAQSNTVTPGTAPQPVASSSTNAAANSDEWKELFDGKTLKGWAVTDFAGRGDVTVDPNFRVASDAPPTPAIVAEMGAILTGINWTNQPPSGEYEIALEAMKLDGSDFFCALTVPVGESHCSLIVGGWGGGVLGISSVDSMDASENETSKFLSFDKNRWYHVGVRVTKKKLEVWLDREKMIDLDTTDRRIAVRAGEIELAKPLGISAYQTRSAWRNIKLREF